jgi:gamma-polyglutamate synthase
MNRTELHDFFASGLNPFERKLQTRWLTELTSGFTASCDSAGLTWRSWAEAELLAQSVPWLGRSIAEGMTGLKQMRDEFREFNRRLASAGTEDLTRVVMLDYARTLGATPKSLRADRRSFRRWFGPDALTDRYRRIYGESERRIVFYLDRLGTFVTRVLKRTPETQPGHERWQALGLEALIEPILKHDGDARVVAGAFRCLARALQALPTELGEIAVRPQTLQYVYRSAQHAAQDVWIQSEALGLLKVISPDSFDEVVQKRFDNPGTGDDLFTRARAVTLLENNMGNRARRRALLVRAAGDPSAFVRQAVCAALCRNPSDETLESWMTLTLRDSAPQVRAAGLVAGLDLIRSKQGMKELRTTLVEILGTEKDPFVLRTACWCCEQTVSLLAEANHLNREWIDILSAALTQVQLQNARTQARRWAARAREWIWVESTPERRQIRQNLQAEIPGIRRGTTRRLKNRALAQVDDAELGRVLAVVCRDDFGCDVEVTRRARFVTRGHVFGFRLWRLIHEVRTPGPEKRQAFRHTIGRLFYGSIRAPSQILSELAKTNVPGEPLHIAEEGTGRPYLPLPDELISVLFRRRSKPVRLYTPEGVTRILPPAGFNRLKAFVRLNLRFKHYADLRNWREHFQRDPGGYLEELRKLGFEIDLIPHADGNGLPQEVDSRTGQFFSIFLAAMRLPEWTGEFFDYFVSIYENSLGDLALFLAAISLAFCGLHFRANSRFRFFRKSIPLSVGGWGTRGKSGTERLKAGIFNAMGCAVVSKTTGCEAMFLYAPVFGELKEMFLFRPYDKATIWEQCNVVRSAAQLRTDVFLWECMGLTPSYVEILQKRWMQDELATITNAYPDHEDLQGPAGVNIPDVISSFIPRHSKVISTEEQMSPILAEASRNAGTEYRQLGWLEAGLLPPEILSRFPYDEHPYNIALVVAMCEELAIERDVALKEMADRVVPDLGVLRTSPVCEIQGRRLQFTNGMSANERLGFLGNWSRTGFDRQDFKAEPGVWITTVVNNRADRIPRSRIFASVLVNDAKADRHFLIGGNLEGLMGYVEEEWQVRALEFQLWPPDATRSVETALQALSKAADELRIPVESDLIQARLRAMLSAVDLDDESRTRLSQLHEQPDELKRQLPAQNDSVHAILRSLESDLVYRREYQELVKVIRDSGETEGEVLEQRFRKLLKVWFLRKFVVVEDYYATGEEVVNTISQTTPPGFLNRVMGIQNIKGTGLDFVYRWEAWRACHAACEKLASDNDAVAASGLEDLATFQGFGLLSESRVREVLQQTRRRSMSADTAIMGRLQMVEDNLERTLTKIRALLNKEGGTSRTNGWFARFVSLAEELLDSVDAIRRRRKADRIQADLVAERISRERAALELQKLNKRQKGGWLKTT